MATKATPTPRTTPTDAFPWWAAILAYGIAGTLAWRIRQHGDPMRFIAGLLPLGIVCLAATADLLEGARRKAASVVGCSTLILTLFVAWQGSLASWAIPMLMPPAVAILIGYQGGKKHKAKKARHAYGALEPGAKGFHAEQKGKAGFNQINLYLPPGCTKEGQTVTDSRGTIRQKFFVPSGTPKWDPDAVARHVATDLKKAHGLVYINDLKATRVGLHELVIAGRLPFDLPAKPRSVLPTPARICLGFDGQGQYVWMDLIESDAQHMLIAGTTGSGKSTFLRWLLLCWHHLGAEIWAGDPKGGKGLRAAWCATRYAKTDTDCKDLLRDAYAEMVNREQTAGEDDWSGSWLVVVIDEFSAVADKDCAPWIKAIIKRGRSSRVVLIGADQSTRVGSVGGGDVKANFPTRVAFRTMSVMENQLILEENIPGFMSNEISRDTPGRCIVKGLPSVDWVQVQTWNVRTPSVAPGAPLPAPLPPPNGNNGTLGSGPPSMGPHAGETHHSEHSEPSERNPRTEHDGTDLDNAIAQLLAPTNPGTQSTKDRVLGELDGMARTTKEVGDAVGISERMALNHLNDLVAKDLARKVPGGWIRA